LTFSFANTKIPPDVAAAMNRIHYYEGIAVEPSTLQRQLDMMARYGALPPIAAAWHRSSSPYGSVP
jgi:hypothetical protein